MFLAALIIFLVFLLYIFVSRKRSPVPYFPTNKKDIPLIIKALNLKLNHTVVDLGAGDGVVIFKAAEETYKRGFGTKFYAVEINPILILILYLKKLFHENRKNIHILFDDFTKMDLKRFDNAMFYLYLSPKYLNIVYKRIKSEVKKPKIVTYFYKPNKIVKYKKIIGANNLYFPIS